MKSDAEIRDDVINELYWDPQVTEPEAIGVAVRDGAVTLTGHVPSYAEKLAAARAAERVYGVKAVANDLKVQFSRAPRDDSDIAAAVYGASEGLRTIVLDGTTTGGQAGTSARIENYLGFPSGISGAELAERAMLQARKFGAEFVVPAEAASIEKEGGQYLVRLADGSPVTATSVVIATGARYRRLDVPQLDHFEQMSVYYAASQAEALLCAGDPVAVVGGGNSPARRRSSCPGTRPRSPSSCASTT